MIVTKTARQKLLNYTRYLDYTLDVYRLALEYVIQIVYKRWNQIQQIDKSKRRINYVEHLIHSTAKNHALYDFDQKFYKFPSYFRRAVISEAIGYVSSYMTRYKKWEEKNKKRLAKGRKPIDRPPKFTTRCKSFPVFYKNNMSKWIENGKVALKVYTGTDWIWFVLPFQSIKPNRFPEKDGWVKQNPMLVKKVKRWRLHIPFKKEVKLENKNFNDPVLAVDLGLNHPATCSVVYSDGTVAHRQFLSSYEAEKDHLNRLLGHIAKKSKQTWLIPTGQKFCKLLWNRVNSIADSIAHQCSNELIKIAEEWNCQVIVFEHLGKLKVPKNFWGAKRLRKKLHYWMQGRIQRYTKYKGHAKGIKFSRVWSSGTSKYAYDGSGEVIRIHHGKVAIFENGKIYNADLNASYNIAARYWIREFLDPKSRARNGIVVGSVDINSIVLPARHQQTLASLTSLVRLMAMPSDTGRALYSSQVFSFKGKPPLYCVSN